MKRKAEHSAEVLSGEETDEGDSGSEEEEVDDIGHLILTI